LAAAVGVAADDTVTVESRRGKVRFKVALSDGIRPDAVFAPVHRGGDRAANILTIAARGPTLVL
jgi:anaerobic selenocysteine-containing dehydrogenase